MDGCTDVETDHQYVVDLPILACGSFKIHKEVRPSEITPFMARSMIQLLPAESMSLKNLELTKMHARIERCLLSSYFIYPKMMTLYDISIIYG